MGSAPVTEATEAGGGKIGTMTAVQRPWFEAVDRLEGLVRARAVPDGYERNYRRGKLFVSVCPWHWRAYSHYQFWELLAAAHMAKLKGMSSTVLVTNGEWTDWCWDAFAQGFDRVVVAADERQAVAEVERLLAGKTAPGRKVPTPEPGGVFFGATRKSATTMSLKASLAEGLHASGERVDKRASVPAYFGGKRSVTFHHKLSNGLVVDAKGFRNPDPVHELKILAGKAFAIGPERAKSLLYVVDGRIARADVELVTISGASVTTPDEFRAAVRATDPRPRAKGKELPLGS